MLDKINPAGFFQMAIERLRGHKDILNPAGSFVLEQWRDNGGLFHKVSERLFTNDTTNVGKNYMLSAAFLGATQGTSWHIGLIDGTATTPTLSNADTMSSHGGWAEFTDVMQTTRPSWTAVANTGSNQIITNTSAQWTIAPSVNPAGMITGGFIVSNNIINGTSGVLWSTGKFNAPVAVQSGDVFKVNYITGL